MPSVTPAEIQSRCQAALEAHGCASWAALEVARATREAEEAGNKVCGLYYLESYCTQLTTGRVKGDADPVVSRPAPGTVLVDAGYGFAQAAFARALPTALAAAREAGTLGLAISHAHTCTALGFFTRQIAEAGLIGIGLTNAPACVAPPGGHRAVLGTNPIAMSAPDGRGGLAFQWDFSTSAVAIGKIRMAASAGETIPLGWAVDKDGQPTSDPKAGLEGALVSAGGYKGFGFGLMAETLAAAVCGTVLSTQAEPLKAPRGGPHDLGQYFLLIDPDTYGGGFAERMAHLSASVTAQQGARMPGTARPAPESVAVDDALWQQVLKLSGA